MFSISPFHMYVEFVFKPLAYQLEFQSEGCPQTLWRWGRVDRKRLASHCFRSVECFE